MYGYEILKRLRELFEGVWNPRTGSLYPSLRRLEEHGLIKSEERKGTSYYSLTEEGEEWTNQALKSLPVDVMMISRWFMRTLREAAGMPLRAEGQADLYQENFGEVLREFLKRKDEDRASKLEHLRSMKRRMSAYIQEIEKIEEELEREEERR